MDKDKTQSQGRESMSTLIRKNSLFVLIERSIDPVVNLLVTIYIVRKLSVDEYGIYNILFALLGYVALISSLGLPNIFQRFIPEFYQKNQIAKLKKLVDKGLLFGFVLCVGILLIIFLFSKQISELFKFKGAFRYLIVFSVAIVFYFESGLLNVTLFSIFHHKKYVISQISYVLFRALILYFILERGGGLVGLLIAESLSCGLLFLLLFYHYRRFLAKYSLDTSVELPVRRLMRFGGFSYFNELGAVILDVSTDFFVISAFLGPVAVGIYAFANRVMKLSTHVLPQSVFINIIRPAFFSKYAQDENLVQLNKMFNFLVKITAFFSFPLVIGVIVLGDKLIIHIFDPKYLESLKVLWIVAGFTSMYFFVNPLGLVLQSTEKVQILLYSKVFAIYNLIGDLLVVKSFGVVGVALVTGSAVLFKNVFCYFFARKYARLITDFKALGKIVLNSFILGVVLYLLRNLIVSSLSFIVVIFVGGIIYFAISYFNRAFSEEERRIINKILPKPVFAF